MRCHSIITKVRKTCVQLHSHLYRNTTRRGSVLNVDFMHDAEPQCPRQKRPLEICLCKSFTAVDGRRG